MLLQHNFQEALEAAARRAWPTLAATDEPTGDIEGDNDSLEDAARAEQDYLRQRLREQLNREPTEQELDDWLRKHTEGY
jgi:hypothetical protein